MAKNCLVMIEGNILPLGVYTGCLRISKGLNFLCHQEGTSSLYTSVLLIPLICVGVLSWVSALLSAQRGNNLHKGTSI